LSGRAEACVDVAASGTAAMGGGKVGVWHVWGEDGGVGREVTGTGGVVGGTSRATESPPPLVDFAFLKNLASARCLEEAITEPATIRITKQRLIQMRQNGSSSQAHASKFI